MRGERTEQLEIHLTPEEVSILDQLVEDQNSSRDEVIGKAIRVMKVSLITEI